MVKSCYPYLLEKFNQTDKAIKANYLGLCDNCGGKFSIGDTAYFSEQLSDFFCLECAIEIIEAQFRYIKDQKTVSQSIYNQSLKRTNK